MSEGGKPEIISHIYNKGWIWKKGNIVHQDLACFVNIWLLNSILNIIFWLDMAKIRATNIGIEEFDWKSSKCESKSRKGISQNSSDKKGILCILILHFVPIFLILRSLE